jgi:hypothetical protein
MIIIAGIWAMGFVALAILLAIAPEIDFGD